MCLSAFPPLGFPRQLVSQQSSVSSRANPLSEGNGGIRLIELRLTTGDGSMSRAVQVFIYDSGQIKSIVTFFIEQAKFFYAGLEENSKWKHDRKNIHSR